MMTHSIVSVEIAGQRYPIRSTLDAAYVAELAAYVDTKMRTAAEATPSSDMLGLALLVALNIADECFRARQQTVFDQRRVERARPAPRTPGGRRAGIAARFARRRSLTRIPESRRWPPAFLRANTAVRNALRSGVLLLCP